MFDLKPAILYLPVKKGTGTRLYPRILQPVRPLYILNLLYQWIVLLIQVYTYMTLGGNGDRTGGLHRYSLVSVHLNRSIKYL